MKKLAFMLALSGLYISTLSCANAKSRDNVKDNNSVVENSSVKPASANKNGSGVITLNKADFLTKVFDYEKNKEWNYAGELPAIVDFYADWCGPCKMLSPVLEEIQQEYKGKIQIYKVNTDKEREVAMAFGIRSLPTIIFIPKEGQPQAVMGFRPKDELENAIKEVLKVDKPQ